MREIVLELSESNVIKSYYIEMKSNHTRKMNEQLNVRFEFSKCENGWSVYGAQKARETNISVAMLISPFIFI